MSNRVEEEGRMGFDRYHDEDLSEEEEYVQGLENRLARLLPVVRWAAKLSCACGTIDGVPQPKGNCISDVANAVLYFDRHHAG